VSQESLYSVLKNIPDVQLLDFTHTPLSLQDCKAIGKVLSDFKNIRELVLNNCSLTTVTAKEIADGLMRAKQLEVLKMLRNQFDVSGIVYNLAFSPKIKMIDISGNEQCTNSQVVEAFFKLLKISGSIKSLVLSHTGIVKQLNKDFFIALGQNKTLEHLYLDNHKLSKFAKETVTPSVLSGLLKGVAMNKYKNGSLSHLSLSHSCNNIKTSLDDLFKNLQVSDQDHEYWYGEKKLADEMKLHQLEPKF